MKKTKTIMLLVTYKCNLRCSYCYEPKIDGFCMTIDRAKKIVNDQLNCIGDNYDSVEIHFMGGEPLMEYPLIKEVAEWVWNKHFPYKITMFAPTNGTLLSDEMKSWFRANRDKFRLGLSFDGDETMQNTNRTGSASKVDLDFFVSTYPEQSVKMTVSPKTVSSMADGIIFLHNMKFRHIRTDLAMGDTVIWDKTALLEYKRNLDLLSDYYIEHNEIEPVSLLNLDLKLVLTPPRKDIKACGCGESLICLDWTGKSYACHLFSPVTIPINKAKKSNRIYDFCDKTIFFSDKCSKCILNNICNHCVGMNYVCTGDVTNSPAEHCSAMKLQFVANCRFRNRLAKKENDIKTIELINNILNSISL